MIFSLGTSTPRRTKTPSFSVTNRDELQIETSSPISAAQDDEQGGATSKEYSRRLVEYFVVVSSVPKLVANRERVNSIERADGGGKSNDQNIRKDTELPTPKQTNHKSLTVDIDGANANQSIPPPPAKSTTNKITPRMAARVDKRRGHLKDSFRPGESVIPALSMSAPNTMISDDADHAEPVQGSNTASFEDSIKQDCEIQTTTSVSAQHHNNKAKGSLFPSMSEQKKKFKKKLSLQAAGLQQQLETKMKSISIGRSFSGDSEKYFQDEHDADDSSFSSFSNDEDSPSRILPPVAFQPSTSPTTPKRCLAPSYQPPVAQKEGGASENIRIDDSFFSNPGREFNNDIDDCILEPVITAQYPPVDHPDQPLNPMLTHFCHPQGVENIVPVHEYKMPKIHHFVLTDSKGGKLYGTCLTVYEEFLVGSDGNQGSIESDENSVPSVREEDQERTHVECSLNGPPTVRRHRRRSANHKYYAPRVLCLLSTWPYLSAFRTYLTQLYRLATTTTLMTAPLERYILNICEEVSYKHKQWWDGLDTIWLFIEILSFLHVH